MALASTSSVKPCLGHGVGLNM
ncbi:hypothetical protein F383_33849 [Gossypium arboreum]|uniref:Uncharacterized protein n=1 Tax=Gossypium arboreum TaxID=29729 RepID=A0A0B0N4T9_GOSAR|nr:hypothetical protein F383_33849 [Gossypium arboreum]